MNININYEPEETKQVIELLEFIEKQSKKIKDISENANLLLEVEELMVNGFVVSRLKANNINTVGDLMGHSIIDLLRYPNIGRKTVKEISQALSPLGLWLDGDNDGKRRVQMNNGN